ncbi:MAG TPA: twin-arginine translocase TatA/TatE family subunit [Candidatus Limnocylindrales bacterium]|nr:twin-arginine translocase TatA/TatE family subunit [Candidatus Limnocylindrales bacterium]
MGRLAAAGREKNMDLFAPTHLLIILVIILVIFGPSKLGDVGGAMGKAIRDFKRAMNEPDDASKTVAKPDEAKAAEPEKPPYKIS